MACHQQRPHDWSRVLLRWPGPPPSSAPAVEPAIMDRCAPYPQGTAAAGPSAGAGSGVARSRGGRAQEQARIAQDVLRLLFSSAPGVVVCHAGALGRCGTGATASHFGAAVTRALAHVGCPAPGSAALGCGWDHRPRRVAAPTARLWPRPAASAGVTSGAGPGRQGAPGTTEPGRTGGVRGVSTTPVARQGGRRLRATCSPAGYIRASVGGWSRAWAGGRRCQEQGHGGGRAARQDEVSEWVEPTGDD